VQRLVYARGNTELSLLDGQPARSSQRPPFEKNHRDTEDTEKTKEREKKKAEENESMA